MTSDTPSARLKRLYIANARGDESLKDFAVNLASNGTAEESNLVHTWFSNKSKSKSSSEK